MLLCNAHGVYYGQALLAGDGEYISILIHRDVHSLQSEANKRL